MNEVNVIIGMLVSGAASATGMWLYMYFRKSCPVHVVAENDAETIRKISMQADYYKARSNYYENFAKGFGLPRKSRFPSFEVWMRLFTRSGGGKRCRK